MQDMLEIFIQKVWALAGRFPISLKSGKPDNIASLCAGEQARR
jgi:hypothetical protein